MDRVLWLMVTVAFVAGALVGVGSTLVVVSGAWWMVPFALVGLGVGPVAAVVGGRRVGLIEGESSGGHRGCPQDEPGGS